MDLGQHGNIYGPAYLPAYRSRFLPPSPDRDRSLKRWLQPDKFSLWRLRHITELIDVPGADQVRFGRQHSACHQSNRTMCHDPPPELQPRSQSVARDERNPAALSPRAALCVIGALNEHAESAEADVITHLIRKCPTSLPLVAEKNDLSERGRAEAKSPLWSSQRV